MKRLPLLIQLVIYSFIVLIILLGSVGTIFYHTASSAIERRTELQTQASIDQSQQFISSYLKKLKQATSSLAKNPQLLDYARQTTEEKETALSQLMTTVLATDDDLVSAIFVTKTGQVLSTDQSLHLATSSDMMTESWYQQAIHQGGLPVVIPASQQLGSGKWVVSVTQEVLDAQGQHVGVLRLDTDYHTLEAYLNHLQLGKKGFAFIVNSHHDFVYHPKHSVYSSSREMKAMAPYIAVGTGYTKDSSAYVSQELIADSDWRLIGVASMEELQGVQRQIFYSFLGTGLIGLGICLIGISLILNLWIRPIKELQETILAIGSGASQVRAVEKGSQELVVLAQAFNQMLDKIDQLMAQVKEEEQNVRRYELHALSSQINPHFLYNTLDTIVWMAEFNDSRRVVEVTKSLAKYFRLALNQGNEQIRLKDEIDHVRQYLFIQKERYGDKLSYQIDELEIYHDYVLPKLILQPLVENAIYHGIKESDRVGQIIVSVSETSEHLLLRVFDNGLGFQDKSRTVPHLGGVGLKNIDQRLRLQFGASYHMKIDSQKGKMTCVTLYLPRK